MEIAKRTWVASPEMAGSMKRRKGRWDHTSSLAQLPPLRNGSRSEVKRSEASHSTDTITDRGVHLSWLLAFTQAYGLFQKETWWVVDNVIKPLTRFGSKVSRLIDLPELAGFVGKSDAFVSHAWGGRWGDLVLGLVHNLPADVCVFVDAFAILQLITRKDLCT